VSSTVNHRSDGRFAPGNKAGQGNVNNKRMSRLRTALLAAASPEQVQQVIRKLGEQAIAGDVAAARVYLDHVVGKPPQAIELGGLHVEPLFPPEAQQRMLSDPRAVELACQLDAILAAPAAEGAPAEGGAGRGAEDLGASR
jgi:hypothetical protein